MTEKMTGTSDFLLEMWHEREVPKAKEYTKREDRGSKIMKRIMYEYSQEGERK